MDVDGQMLLQKIILSGKLGISQISEIKLSYNK
jgi:hypothetical protein